MDTFHGCDPDALDDLAGRALDAARRLIELIELLRGTAAAVPWTGPDADAHRRATEAMAAVGIAAGARLRACSSLLQQDAREQEHASQADPGPALRAELPWRGDDGAPLIDLPPLRRPGILDDPGRWIGGPFQARDPLDLFPGGSPLPDLPGGWGPWIGGPFMPTGHPAPSPPRDRGPLPEGEEFALDPEILAEARDERRLALGAIPVVGTVQTAMAVHEGVGQLHDRIGEATEGTAFEPLARVARIPHTASESLLGEGSTVGQLADGLDRSWANVLQTGSEVTAALGEGDWDAAARAGERGLYRNAGTSADLLTITPIPAHAETGADLLGEGADGLRGVSPEAAAGLERAEDALRGYGEDLKGAREALTDAETWYDARRRHLPMPWDPQA